MMDPVSASRAPLPTASWSVALGYLAAGAISLAYLPPGMKLASALNLLNMLVFLHAAAVAWRRSGRHASSRTEWRLIAGCFTSQTLCQAYPLAVALRSDRLPDFPSLGDGFALLTLLFMGLALIAWPRDSREGSEPLQKGLDALGLGLAALFLGWALALEPLFRPAQIPLMVKFATLAFLVATASILGLIFFLALGHWGRLKGTLGWIGLGFVIAFAQILIQVPLGLAGKYYLGHPVDLLVLTAGVALLLATLDPADPADHQSTGWSRFLDDRTLGMIGPALPILLSLVVGMGLLLFSPSRWDRTLIGLSLGMSTLMVLRMLLALRELRNFTQELDQRVRARTRELEDAQAILLRTERLNALASLGAGLAHDLKNLLGVIKNYALLVGQDVAEGRKIQPGDLEAIQQASDQAGGLANQLMTIGREEGDPGSTFDLRTRMNQLVSMLRAALPAYIALEVRVPASPMFLPGDPTRLDQMLINLVLNARDAIEGSGRILVEAQSCTLADGRPGALLVVSDSGVGMSEEVQARIFEPFFTTKSIGSGTGLGLASVKSLVDLMDAEVEVHSVVGRGTTFLLRFPLMENTPEPTSGL